MALLLTGKNVNESMLTGESKPVTKKPENEVIGDSINGEAAFVVKSEKTGKVPT